MIKVDTTAKRPVKMWLDDIEEGALTQAVNVANLPFIHKHVALMPDAHQGYGVPIGCVFGAVDAVIPNAVGVDIGCSIMAVQTDVRVGPMDECWLRLIEHEIRQAIPTGCKHQKTDALEKFMPRSGISIKYLDVVSREWDSACKQLGTLGGGNHFIELSEGSDGFMWVLIHSGSRNVGLQVASHHQKIAEKLNKQWACDVPKDLAFLPLSTNEGRAYVDEMGWCLKFAKENRRIMMGKVIDVLGGHFPFLDVKMTIDSPHNFARAEVHYGKELIVHRKGACVAYKDSPVIIPGSKGSLSYIAKGLGNKMSFQSCSHGAGRSMSRTQAKKTLDLEAEKKILSDLGVVSTINKNTLDEADGAYKDIEKVMENQKDLVEIVTALKPILNIKG